MKLKKEDPLVRERKSLPFSDWTAIPIFFLYLILGLPILLSLLPISLFFVFIVNKIFLSKSPKPFEGVTLDKSVEILDWNKREYDIILFGATGFTGKLAAQYLASQYGSEKIRWGIAGRNETQLLNIRQQLITIDPSLKDLPILICDSSKPETLQSVVANTRVIASTVGPFSLYGSPLVSLCAQLGTSYCDTSGELDWVRKIISQYHTLAQRSGARIVPLSGADCIPWDLLTLVHSNKLRLKNENLQEVRHYFYTRVKPSGGTLSTVLLTLKQQKKQKFPYDPLIQSDENGKSEFHTVIQKHIFPSWSSEIQKWVTPSFMAVPNGNCVRRSNSILGYSQRLIYHEFQVHHSFFALVNFLFTFAFLIIALTITPLRWILEKWVLPKPGSGPSKSEMDQGFLKVESIGKGDKGTITKSTIYFPTDPGYRDTARMLVETALTMVLDSHKLKIGGGIWTPACLGEILLDRLVNTGCTFEFHT